jgi:hypothetical protein
MVLCSARKTSRAQFAGLTLAALTSGLLIAACATAKDYAYVYVPYVAVLNEYDMAAYPSYTSDPIAGARQYMAYLQAFAKAKEAAQASSHSIAADNRRSLMAYVKGIASAPTVYIERQGIPNRYDLQKYEPYSRSVFIGECTGIEEIGPGSEYVITIRIDHANSPALPDVFNPCEEFKMRSNIRAEGNRVPFELGVTYMIYAEKFALMWIDDTEEEDEKSELFPWRRDYWLGAWIHGIDDFDRELLPRELLPRELQDTSLPARLLSTSPYQKAGGIDFDIGAITGADMTFEVAGLELMQRYYPRDSGVVNLQVWSDEALQYAPFIKLDTSGAAGALNSKAGFLWKKWIALAQIAQSTVEVIAINRWDAAPYFADVPHVSGRVFTEAEYRDGAKVCVISGSLADQNGLNIGDTIPLAFFNNGYSHRYLEGKPDPFGLLPIPYTMSGAQMDSPVEYKIIGFFKSPDIGDGGSFIEFDANTVIIPGASIKEKYAAPLAAPLTDPETGEKLIPVTPFYLPERYGMFSVVLKPGASDAFQEEMTKRGWGGLWSWYGGYTVAGRPR